MPGEKIILLPLSYLGPLQLYCRYYDNSEIVIEQHDTYQKQTFRNRCDIYGANGKLSLVIPVKHEKGIRLKVKDIRIDYATDWRRLHWKGIVSAYNSSPYFEFYQDIFEPYYKKEFHFLVDFCMQLNDEILKILGISKRPMLTREFSPVNNSTPHLTKEFEKNTLEIKDLRMMINPKTRLAEDAGFKVINYTQVFSLNTGFIPNLSILDLIFNMGPESGRVLISCRV